MNLGQIIHQLLLENETVIIPGFGAFISNYKPAVINEDTQEITPPSKEITFNQKIRNNDGLLVGHVAETLSVSHFDALKHIEKKRENIIYKLDKGEKVKLKETGFLSLNEKQEIQFEPFIEDNLLLDSFGLETISLKEDESKNNEVIVDPEIINKEKTEQKTTDEIQDNDPEENAPEPIIVVKQNEKPAPEILIEKQVREQEEIVAETEDLTKLEEEPIKESEPALPEEAEEKKKRGWLWILLIFIPIIIAGIFVANNEFYSKEPEAGVPNKNREIQPLEPEKQIIVTDSIKTDSVQISKTDSIPLAESTEKVVQNTSDENDKYFLIGGSFKEEINAQKFIDQFEIEGYKPFHMGKIGNFYFVGFESFKTEAEAVVAKREFLDKNPDSGIWVYEKN